MKVTEVHILASKFAKIVCNFGVGKKEENGEKGEGDEKRGECERAEDKAEKVAPTMTSQSGRPHTVESQNIVNDVMSSADWILC